MSTWKWDKTHIIILAGLAVGFGGELAMHWQTDVVNLTTNPLALVPWLIGAFSALQGFFKTPPNAISQAVSEGEQLAGGLEGGATPAESPLAKKK